MSYKQIKWLILIIPTLIIGLWEYVRHEFLLPYISMELGNILSPFIIFFVTITLLLRLFQRYEELQEQLKKERAEKAVLQERERIARELHDGIAQTLFLCSVQVNRMKQKAPNAQAWEDLDKNLRQIHENVRYSIYNLKNPSPTDHTTTWKVRLEELVRQFHLETRIPVNINVELEETKLSTKEKVELIACIQEALANIRKHAQATNVSIHLSPWNNGWILEVEDDGQGFTGNPFQKSRCFGLTIMQERAAEMKASLTLSRHQNKTRLVIRKKESKKE